jgi:dihydroceramidase
MTGIGSYFYIVWAIWLRHCLNERQDEYVLNWPSKFFSIPEVVPISVVERQNSYRNSGKERANGVHGREKTEERKSV